MRKKIHYAGIQEIANALDVSHSTVVNWRRRHADFPAPIATLSFGSIWDLPKVLAWAERKGLPRRTLSERSTRATSDTDTPTPEDDHDRDH